MMLVKRSEWPDHIGDELEASDLSQPVRYPFDKGSTADVIAYSRYKST
jgi:hypothetical protein